MLWPDGVFTHPRDRLGVPADLHPAEPPTEADIRALAEAADSYFSVYYRDRWFWIEDNDWRSKAMFSFVTFMFTLGGRQAAQNVPVLTIPTQ